MRNRYLDALKEPANILGLTTTAAVAAAMLNPVVLALGIAAELIYLAFVPDMKWYQARLSKLYDADIEKQRAQNKAQVFPTLRPEMKERFERLEKVRAEIGKQSPPDADWFREVLRKLDFLLDKFLQFAGKEAQFRTYLLGVLKEMRDEEGSSRIAREARRKLFDDGEDDTRSRLSRDRQRPNSQAVPRNTPSTPRASLSEEDRRVQMLVAEVQAHYDRDLNGIQQLAEVEPDSGTKAVLEKRVEVLSRRREFVGKIGRIMINLNHQLCLLEDTFGLISDEIRARPPEQVLADIEDVVIQANSMTQALEEMAPYEQMLNRSVA